jgi:alpha-beta hydrolase superfamily lysophospholipase
VVKQLDPTGMLPLLNDPRPKVRMKAVKAIREKGMPSSAPALADLLHREQDPKVMGAIVSALRDLGGDDVAAALVYAIQAPHVDGWTRGACAMELARYPGNPAALEALIRALADESGYVRQQAALALARYDDPRAAAAVSEAFAAGAIKPPTRTSLVPVAVARTLEVFVGDDAVRQAVQSRIGPDTRIVAALRLSQLARLEGGVVALEDRVLVALRQVLGVFEPKDVDRVVEIRYEDVDDIRCLTNGFELRSGETILSFHPLANWLWEQWEPHVTWMIEAVASAHRGEGKSHSEELWDPEHPAGPRARIDPGPGVVEGTFKGATGRVFYRIWSTEGEPRRIVQIVHGYAEHGGRYAHVAEALTRQGAVVVADDHSGHGRSDGERALITDFEEVVEDLHALAAITRAEHPGLPLVLVGHSMGGLLAGRFCQRWPAEVAGVAFCGAVIGDWQWARDVLATPELPHIPFDPLALSRDPEVGAAYAEDPLVYHGQYKRGLLEAEVDALDRFQEDVARLTMPVLFLHGSEDPFVPYQRSLRAVQEMPTRDLTIHVYPGARHEVLNEINRDEVIGHMADWIDRIA